MKNINMGKGDRKSRVAWALLLIGVSSLFFRSTLNDYVRGLFAPNGLYIPNSTYRLTSGDVKSDGYSHTFRIYNMRFSRLTLETQPDCSCTSISWHKTTIPPLGWAELTATMSDLPKNGSYVGIALSNPSSSKSWAFMFLKS